jgi:hypothetical protein
MRCYRLTLLVGFLFVSLAAFGQVGIYANFSAAQLNVGNTNWVYGPTIGAYYDAYHFGIASAGLDLRAQLFNNNANATLDSGLVGLRLAAHPPVFPLKPYIEGLAGIGHAEFSATGATTVYSTSATRFEYSFLAGLDYTLLPHIDWRVAEFSYGGISALGGSFNPKVLSTGIVVRVW